MNKALIATGLLVPFLFACEGSGNAGVNNTGTVDHSATPPVKAEAPKLTVVDRPQKIKDLTYES